MLTFVKDSAGNHKANTGNGTYTIRKRPDGYFDLYKGRVRLNEKRGRLKDLKAQAEVLAAPLTGADLEEFHALPTYVEETTDIPELDNPTTGGEQGPDFTPAMPEASLASGPGTTPENSTDLGIDHVPEDRPNGWGYYDTSVGEDDAVARLKDLHPKARDMVDRATTLLPEKAVPMPGADRRTDAKDDPLQVEADWYFLYAWEGQYAVTLEREDFLDPAVAFARVPRGTARKLRKALRAAGRPDLAAVSRHCMNPDYL